MNYRKIRAVSSADRLAEALRELVACKELHLRYKVAIPDSPRHKNWAALKAFPARDVAAWSEAQHAIAAYDAAPRPQPLSEDTKTINNQETLQTTRMRLVVAQSLLKLITEPANRSMNHQQSALAEIGRASCRERVYVLV